MRVFVDSNVPIYVAGQEHDNKPPADRFFEKVVAGEIEACCSTEVLNEILFRYARIGNPTMGGIVYDQMVELCAEIFEVNLRDTDGAREMLSATHGLSPRSALHAAVMRNRELQWIATFDTAFDRIPGVSRLPLTEP